jgi:fumarate hydratase subunit beta
MDAPRTRQATDESRRGGGRAEARRHGRARRPDRHDGRVFPRIRRILDCIRSGEALPVDLKHSAFFHLGSYSREDGDGFEVLYMNPTTSTRFNDMMPEIIRHFGLALRGRQGRARCRLRGCSEGGWRSVSVVSRRRSAAALGFHRTDTQGGLAGSDLALPAGAMEVRGLGPLAVAIDAHGNNLYDKLSEQAQNRRAGISLQSLRAARG